MPLYRRSLLDVETLTPESIEELFTSASLFLDQQLNQQFVAADPLRLRHYIVALLFFEPSTRTRMSFEVAAARLGVSTLRLDDVSASSLVKGETLKDALLNVSAMGPHAIVLRYGEDPELTAYISRSPVPILIAGQGARSHPTQALLDAFTIRGQRGQIQGERVLIVGDVSHSRVAHSNLSLLKKLGAEVAVSGPPSLIQLSPEISKGVRVFKNIDEGLRWASVCMTLRIQLERLDKNSREHIDRDQYRAEFGFTKERLRLLSQEGIILHPGPINQNVELDSDVLEDPRCHVLTQVSNGVAIRAAVLSACLGLKGSA